MRGGTEKTTDNLTAEIPGCAKERNTRGGSAGAAAGAKDRAAMGVQTTGMAQTPLGVTAFLPMYVNILLHWLLSHYEAIVKV